MELADLVLEELRLQPQQWELKPGVPNHLPELYCLVHEDWLTRAKDGGPLPLCAPGLDPTEIHWLLQPSCEGPTTKPWKRLYVVCIAKGRNCTEPVATRLPVYQGEGFSQQSISHFMTQVAHENQLLSWKQLMTALQGHVDGYPVPSSDQLLPCSAVVRHIVKCLYGTCVKQLRTNGSANRSKDGQRDDPPKGGSQAAKTPSHPNFLQPEVVLESEHAFYFVFPYARFTVFDVVTHSPAALQDSVVKSKFVLYQLLTLLAHCHAQGVTLGDITMRDLFVDARLWVQLGLPHGIFRGTPPAAAPKTSELMTTAAGTAPTPPPAVPARPPATDGTVAGAPLPHPPATPSASSSDSSGYVPPNLCLSEALVLWKHGRLSNFDYLMFLNHLAGRRMGDPNNHPIMPWVMDFSSRQGGFRDLTKSKYRIEKGDDQLDYTFMSAREEAWRSHEKDGSTPHHIGNISTDVTYYVYLARRTCKEVLCSRVRPQWVPGEYPGTMERMYKWSPDECIPEFFTDPLVFKSIHSDLPDLAIPGWCSSPEELVRVHRGVLEGDHVSAHLHRWIDLMFGFQLAGDAAYRSKNVYLTLVDNHTGLSSSGVVQLFRSSHPKRVLGTSAPLALLEWQTYLAQSTVAAEANFETQRRAEEEEAAVSAPEAMGGDGDERTLESILWEQSKQATQLAAPGGGEGVLEDSFEHVATDELIVEGTTPVDIFMPATRTTIDYGVSPSDAGQISRAVLNTVTSGGRHRDVVPNWLRMKKPSADASSDYHPPHVDVASESSQRAMIAFPKGTKMNANLATLEEQMHFVLKSCRQTKEVFKRQWEIKDMTSLKNSNSCHSVIDLLRSQEENPSVVTSFSQRVAMDIAAVTCTMVEICLNKQLRAVFSAFPSLYQRATTILEMRKGGMLQLPVHLESLVVCVLAPDSDRGLPEVSATLLLQQFVTLVPFPSYFGILYSFLGEVEQLCRRYSLSSSNLKSFPRPKADFETPPSMEPSAIVTFVQERLPSLLPQLDKDGQGLLLLHLLPLFHFPETCFEATVTLIDHIGQYLSKRRMEQLFLMAVLRTYDMAVEPYQKVQLFSRSVVDTLLCRFGLTIFLQRFLGFMLDVVVDPSSLTSKHSPRYTAVKPPLFADKSPTYRPAVITEFAYALNDKQPNDDDGDCDEDSDVEVEGEAEINKVSLLLSHPPPNGSPHPSITDAESPDGDGPQTGDGAPQVGETPAITIGERKNSKEQRVLARERRTATKQGEAMGTPHSKATPVGGKGSSAPTTGPTVVAPTGPAPSTTVRGSNQQEEVLGSEEEREIANDPGTFGSSSARTSRNLDDWDFELPEEVEAGTSRDPQRQAMDASVVEVVADTVCWLVRRFGPLLATRYIIKPLRDNLYRSFMSLKGQRAMAVRCLKAFAIQSNRDTVPLKLYLPFAEDLVSAATNKMNSRAEAGLAASLALVKITVEVVTKVDKGFAKRLCDMYFIPLIQLISSQVSFPSGGLGRAAICSGTVHVLQQLAQGMVDACGRETTMEVMQPTLQSFFNCFGVFQPQEGRPLKPKSPAGLQGEGKDDIFSQLSHTFNHAMAHAAYIPFCLTLGQINVGKLLNKKDLVEQMAYSYDEVTHKRTLPCVFHPGDYKTEEEEEGEEVTNESSDSDVDKPSDDEEDIQLDAALSLGPMGSIHVIKKLDKEATNFGRSTWFVDAEGEGVEKVGVEGVVAGDAAKSGEGVEASGAGTLKRGGDRVSITSRRSRALKPTIEDTISEGVVPISSATSLSSAAFETKYKEAIAQIETKKHKKGSIDDSVGLAGNWLNTWESQLTLSPYHEPSFNNFEAKAVQSIPGHQGEVRTLTVPDSEQYFVSSGKDKTSGVKLWTVHSLFSSSSAVTHTQEYKHKGVFAVELLDQVQQLVTCDGGLLVWDIQTACCLQQFNFHKNNRVVAMAMVNSPQPAICAVSGDGVLRFIDLRSKAVAYSWKSTIVGGTCGSIATHDNWVVVGSTDSGLVSCTDLRMGEPVNSWKLAETPGTAPWGDGLVKLKATKRGALLASIGSGYISMWKPVSAKHVWSIKGHGSSVLCLETVGEELLSASGNSVVVYPSFELVKEPVPYQCNVKSKIKGGISALAALPQNRFILGGTEGGQLIVMS